MIDTALEQGVQAALGRADYAGASTLVLRGYGPQILSYLRAVLREEELAVDTFSLFCELLWNGIPKFRGESAFRTWAYQVAWSAVRRSLEDPYRRRVRRLQTTEMSGLIQEIFTSTATAEREDRLAKLRATLNPEEQTLLILRIDRGLSWSEIVRVLSAAGVPIEEAALRKRYQRLTSRLRRLAQQDGLL